MLMGQTAFHLINYKINLHFGNFWLYFFKIPFKQWDELSMCKIQQLILLLSYNKILSLILVPKKLLTAWRDIGRQQEDVRLEELRMMKFDLAGKTKVLDIFNLEKILEGHWVGRGKKMLLGVYEKKIVI